ncbi:MAG: serine/threonine protein kinase, partial [Bacillariaceae sp.]
RKKTKTNNNNNNNNKNELLWSLFWGRGRAGRGQQQKIKKQQQQQQAYIDDGDSNSDEYFTTNTYFNDEDFYKKRIKETLKKFYKLNDFQTRFAIKASTVSSVIIAVDTAVVSMESTITTVDDDDDDNTDIDDDVLLQGTVLEVFRTPPHQPREAKEYDDDDDDDQDDQDDQDEDHEDEDHVYDNLPSDYYHFLKSQGGDGSDGHNECDSRYMLCEPIHLELGNAPKHYMDFAYTSAVVNSNKPAHSSSSSSLEVESTTDAALSLLFDKHDYNVDEKEDQTTTCKDIVSTATTTTTTNDADHHTSTTTTTTEKDDDNDKTMSFFSAWWNWWLPFTNSDWWKANGSTQSDYDLGTTGAFAGGSNGEVWKGHRVCRPSPSPSPSSSSKKSHEDGCDDQTQLVLKRLRVERGYLLLEAGLREVYFGKLIQTQLNNDEHNMYTVYVDHFFREVPKKRPRINKKSLFGVAGLPANNKHYQQQQQGGNDLELWIVYEDAGPSLRSYIYTPTVTDGGFIMYQHSKLWTQLRTFTNIEQARANKKDTSSSSSIQVQMQTTLDDHDNDGIDEVPPPPLFASSANKKKRSNTNNKKKKRNNNNNNNRIIHIGRLFMQNTLREILSAAAELHKRGIVHRDIKPSNVMCKSDRPLDDIDDYIHSFDSDSPLPKMHCRLGDFSSGWDLYTNEHLYTKGPTSGEQTNEYAPPESFVGPYWVPFHTDKPQSYDSWSVGVLALELLLGTPNVFSVDQRTNAILTYKMKRSNASENEISNALYLAALSNFCIYIPSNDTSNKPQSWPLRHGDPLHKVSLSLLYVAVRAWNAVQYDTSTS